MPGADSGLISHQVLPGSNQALLQERANLRAPLLLRFLRLARGKTQADLARACGISQAAVSNLEAGACDPTLETLLALAHELYCHPHLLTEGEVRFVLGDEAQVTLPRRDGW